MGNNETYLLNSLVSMKTRPDTMDQYVIEEMLKDPYHVRDIVKNNHTILDCGANIGAFARFVLALAPKARVICIEPMPENAQLCVENLRNEQSCVVINAALMGASGQIAIHDFGSDVSACHSAMDYGAKGVRLISVPALTLSELILSHNLKTIDLMKLDVQGAEFEVIGNCPTDILRNIVYITLEIHPCIVGPRGVIGKIPNAHEKVRDLVKKLSATHFLVYGDPRTDSLSITQWKSKAFSNCLERLRSQLRLICRFIWRRLALSHVIPGALADRFRRAL